METRRGVMKRLARALPAWLRASGVRAVELGLRLSSRRAGIVLVYHALGEHPPDLERDVVPAHHTALFEEQLRYASRRYRIVRAGELLEAARRRRRGERFPLAVTFDDDLGSHVRVAIPIMRRAGVPAAFFLCGASLDRPFAFWWERLQRAAERDLDLTPVSGAPIAAHDLALRIEEATPDVRTDFAERLGRLVGDDPADAGLRASDVRTLVDAGFDVGFHTLRHDRLPPLSADELTTAMVEGRAQLEAVTGQRLVAIAYPHGRADEREARAAREAGFTIGFTGTGSAVTASSSPLLQSRIEPAFTDVRAFAGQLAWALRTAHR
ncbi:MAG: polysaccharide deacetylase family protein [Gaiellaceae bacterium]